jgi:hypothetical protein
MRIDLHQRSNWRSKVNHSSPKALRIRAAVKAIHERGEYPGMRKVMNELGEEKYRERPVEPEWIVEGEPMTYTTERWMSGRDNEVRKQMMRELEIKPADDPFADDYDYHPGSWW